MYVKVAGAHDFRKGLLLFLVLLAPRFVLGMDSALTVDLGEQLSDAVYEQDKQAVYELLKRGADINAKSEEDGTTALHLAIICGHVEIAIFLIDSGADVNAVTHEGNTALHFAAAENADKICLRLLSADADVDSENEAGISPVDLAFNKGYQKLAQILQQYSKKDRTEEDSAKSAREEVDIDALSINDRLNVALYYGDDEAVKRILDEGADISANLGGGITPLHAATLAGFDEIIELLLLRNAKVNARSEEGLTPLHLAAARGSAKAVDILLKHKANINARSDKDTTPLHCAAYRGAKNICLTLLLEGATYDARSATGATPAQSALANGHKELAVLLSTPSGLKDYFSRPQQSAAVSRERSQKIERAKRAKIKSEDVWKVIRYGWIFLQKAAVPLQYL